MSPTKAVASSQADVLVSHDQVSRRLSACSGETPNQSVSSSLAWWNLALPEVGDGAVRDDVPDLLRLLFAGISLFLTSRYAPPGHLSHWAAV